MNLTEARSIAEAWLKDLAFKNALITADARETSRSWIFATTFASGEQAYGNAPVVVDKRTRAVRFCRDAWREFRRASRFDLIRSLNRWLRY